MQTGTVKWFNAQKAFHLEARQGCRACCDRPFSGADIGTLCSGSARVNGNAGRITGDGADPIVLPDPASDRRP